MSPSSVREAVGVLLISTHPEDEVQLRKGLAGPEWLIRTAKGLTDALRMLKHGKYSVAICDAELSDGSWRDFLALALSLESSPEVIVASRLADGSLWSEALNLGAWDVIAKPFVPGEVAHVVRYASRQRSVVTKPAAAAAG